MKDWDFGYLGKGLDGYAQYTTAFKRNQRENKTLNAQKATSVRIDYSETPTKPCTPKEKTPVIHQLKQNNKMYLLSNYLFCVL